MDRGREAQCRDRPDSWLQLSHRAEARATHPGKTAPRNAHRGLYLVVRTSDRWRTGPEPGATNDKQDLIAWPRRSSSVWKLERSHPACSAKVPGRGLEPLRIAPPDPKSGASANFATLARSVYLLNNSIVPGCARMPTAGKPHSLDSNSFVRLN